MNCVLQIYSTIRLKHCLRKKETLRVEIVIWRFYTWIEHELFTTDLLDYTTKKTVWGRKKRFAWKLLFGGFMRESNMNCLLQIYSTIRLKNCLRKKETLRVEIVIWRFYTCVENELFTADLLDSNLHSTLDFRVRLESLINWLSLDNVKKILHFENQT